MGSSFQICNDMGETINVSCGNNYNDMLAPGKCSNPYKSTLSFPIHCKAFSINFKADKWCKTAPKADENWTYQVKKHFKNFIWYNKHEKSGRRMYDEDDMDDIDMDDMNMIDMDVMDDVDMDEFDMDEMTAPKRQGRRKAIPSFLKSKGLKGKIINWLVGMADEDTQDTECDADDVQDVLDCLPKCFSRGKKEVDLECPEECKEVSKIAPQVKCTIVKLASKRKKYKMQKLDKCLDACQDCEEEKGCKKCRKCRRTLRKAARVLIQKAYKKGGKGKPVEKDEKN